MPRAGSKGQAWAVERWGAGMELREYPGGLGAGRGFQRGLASFSTFPEPTRHLVCEDESQQLLDPRSRSSWGWLSQ